MSLISEIFSNGVKEAGEVVFNGLDELITSKEEKGEQTIRLEEIKSVNAKNRMDYQIRTREIEFDISEQEYKDRADARKMYKDDSSLQKIFALVFLIGYIGLSTAMVLIVFGFLFKAGPGMELDAFQASIISMVFTAMSTKVNTITDFLFGGSKGKDDSEKRLAEQFEKING